VTATPVEKTPDRAAALVEYLTLLEKQDAGSDPDGGVLWPRTPIGGDHQEKILQRVGVTDRDIHDRGARPSMIIRQLEALRSAALLGQEFSVLDIACGDALVLWQIKRAYPQALCCGVDCYVDRFDTHAMVKRDGVRLFQAFLQSVVYQDVAVPFDVVLMLNSYRSWKAAELRDSESDLPERTDAWFARNARYTFVTAKRAQIAQLRSKGFNVTRLGKGEDRSSMACISTERLPRSWWRRFTGR